MRASSRHLRQRRGLAAWLALVAMLLQVLFATEHASAMAVASGYGGPTGAPLGFLQICTADGLGVIGGDEDAPSEPSKGGETCVLCGAAAVSGALDAGESVETVALPAPAPQSFAPPRTDAPRIDHLSLRVIATRGPPRA